MKIVNTMLALGLKLLKIISIIFIFLILVAAYDEFIHPIGLGFGDEYCLKLASDYLEESKDPTQCPRSYYMSEVENLGYEDKVSALFRFRPMPGREKECPPIYVSVYRRTGEAWPYYEK